MALRIRGKAGYWHAYYVAWERTPDGLRRKHVEVNLGTRDRDVAKSLEVRLMRRAKESSAEARASAKIEAILTGGTVQIQRTVKRRLKIAAALERAARYHDFGITAQNYWKRFQRGIGCVYMDEVTPEIAFGYLDKLNLSGKSYNNMKCALNAVFKTLLLDSGMTSSPFDHLPIRKASTLAQRPFTREEYERLLAVAKSPWSEAMQIAWYTGLRKKDVFGLKWSEIHGDVIRKLPAKTARFRREVLIPIHPRLQAVLSGLKRKGEYLLTITKNDYDRGFNALLSRAGIVEDDSGTVNFNSFRNSFISRCDAAGIPRHAIRGIVGHVSDTQTDLYSHDETSARLIQTLPD